MRRARCLLWADRGHLPHPRVPESVQDTYWVPPGLGQPRSLKDPVRTPGSSVQDFYQGLGSDFVRTRSFQGPNPQLVTQTDKAPLPTESRTERVPPSHQGGGVDPRNEFKAKAEVLSPTQGLLSREEKMVTGSN